MPLVEIKKFDLVTYSIAIAQGVKRAHDTIIKLVDRNCKDLEEFGQVGFEIRAGYNNAKIRVAVLNEPQTTLLMTYMKNNNVVRHFKKCLVAEFFRMRCALASKKMNRNTARLEYQPMTEAIRYEREAQGKDIRPHHVSNTELQRANTVFIKMGWEFAARKANLTEIFNRNHKLPLMQEPHRLTA